MTHRRGPAAFPMLMAAIGTLAMIAFGVLGWFGYGESMPIGVALVLGSVAVSALSPASGLAAVVIALPTMHRLVEMPVGSFTLLELAILTCVMGIGLNQLLLSIRDGFGHLKDLFLPAQVFVPVLLILGATGLAMLNLADPSHQTESFREVRTVLVEPLLFLFAARLVLRNEYYRSWVGVSTVMAGAAIAAYGVAQIVLDLGGVQSGDVTRATAFYTHPNNLALYLERTLLLTLGVIVVRPRFVPMWLLAGVQLVGLLATFSRGAMLGVAVGVAVVLVFMGAWKWILALGAGGVVAVGTALLIFPDRLLDVGGDGEEPTRFFIWRSAIRMIEEFPIFGVGPDQFLYQYSRRFVEPAGWPERYTSHPHNIILDTWLRLGVVGLAAFVVLGIGVIWLIQRNSAAIRTDSWAIGAIAALFGGFAHAMVDNGFFLPDLAVLTWLFVILIATVPHIVRLSVSPAEAPLVIPQSPDPEWPTWQAGSAQ